MRNKRKYLLQKILAVLLIGLLQTPMVSARLILVTEDNEVEADNFIINADDSTTDFVDLEFGSALTASLRYDILNDKFILNEALEVSGDIDAASDISAQNGKHIVSSPWWNSNTNVPGYIKLITPIVHNEGNMFSLKITGYGYNKPGKSFTIDCSGYAYTGSSLLNKGCTTIGTSIEVEIDKEDRGGTEFVVIRLGTPTSNWYYEQFSFEYRGWQPKEPEDFEWVKGETTPTPGVNMNRIVIRDDTGSLSTTGTVTVGAYTLPNTDGTSNQVLATDGSGTLSWQNATGGTGGSSFPFISTTKKDTIAISVQSLLEFEGSNFAPGMVVTIPGFDGTIDSVTVHSPSSFSMLVTPGTTQTIYDVVVTVGGNSNTSFAGNGAGLVEVKNITILVPGSGATSWVRQGQTASNVAVSSGKVVPTITGSGWNKGASFGTIPASTDFLLEFNPVYMAGQSSGGYAMIGVDSTDPNWNYNTIDYAIYMQNGTNYYVYENGTSRGSMGSWSVSDVLGIERVGTTINYLKNGSVVYTSTVPSSAALVFDTSLYRYLGAENIEVTY